METGRTSHPSSRRDDREAGVPTDGRQPGRSKVWTLALEISIGARLNKLFQMLEAANLARGRFMDGGLCFFNQSKHRRGIGRIGAEEIDTALPSREPRACLSSAGVYWFALRRSVENLRWIDRKRVVVTLEHSW